jgi:hypothetical protein
VSGIPTHSLSVILITRNPSKEVWIGYSFNLNNKVYEMALAKDFHYTKKNLKT